MQVLIDTNFIIHIVKNKIDLVEEANRVIDQEINWIVPQQVLNELGSLKDTKGTKKVDKDAAKLSFEILQTLNPKIIELNSNPNVDLAIVSYILDTDIVLATLDKGLKKRVPKNKVLTAKGRKTLELL